MTTATNAITSNMQSLQKVMSRVHPVIW